VIRVERAWDEKARSFTEPKSVAGKRAVPIATVLRDHLDEHLVSCDRTTIGLHEARHSFASLMIAAGVNAKALSTYMGHSSITITLDRYGHLMPGSENEAAGLLDAYLARVATPNQTEMLTLGGS
jgi:integrase